MIRLTDAGFVYSDDHSAVSGVNIGQRVIFALIGASCLGIAKALSALKRDEVMQNIAGYQASAELVLERLPDSDRSLQVAA